ncbi:MAG: EF-P lysine aminoacylase GenX, partial [Ectothiorhodospiraceae bacterium]|nr:EF-P lysine aminoacylase GenX [Ectothiorhodospiraceae bacterium]
GTLYLHTSPEFPMKRLLAAGSGPIWQICRVFRGGERGRRHNPEFTMLEWYRPGWDHHRLMNEVAELISAVVGARPSRTRTYRELFIPLGMDPHTVDVQQCRAVADTHGLAAPEDLGRDGLLDFLFSHLLSPELGRGCIDFVHAFPASQAALARLEQGQPPTAARFECFLDGMEIANGFHELCDAEEQRTRFEADLAFRGQQGLTTPPMDERLLHALAAGLPDCAGVALGLDRLFMVALGAGHIDEVLAFPLERA